MTRNGLRHSCPFQLRQSRDDSSTISVTLSAENIETVLALHASVLARLLFSENDACPGHRQSEDAISDAISMLSDLRPQLASLRQAALGLTEMRAAADFAPPG